MLLITRDAYLKRDFGTKIFRMLNETLANKERVFYLLEILVLDLTDVK